MKKIFCKPFYGMCWLVCLWGIHVPTLVVAKQANKKAKVTFPSSVTQCARASTVSIDASTLVESYELPSQENGNGVVVDRDHGLISTTSFLAGRGVVAAYNVTFYNGEQAEAKLVYYDPLGYCAFLKVDPTAIPKTVTAVKLRKEPPVLHQPIFVWSGENKKNSCKQTMHVGRVADLHYVSQPISQASIVLSMDTIGPTIQGSAIWNKQGEVIGISYAVAETKSFCLDAAYVHYALSFLRKGATPVRRHIGALLDMYSLADAMQYDQFPEAQQKMYAEQFPLALNKVLKVNTILQGTPASQCLLAGDIIWKVDGALVGPSLVDFEHHMNTTKKSDLQLTIFRRGAFCDITDIPHKK